MKKLQSLVAIRKDLAANIKRFNEELQLRSFSGKVEVEMESKKVEFLFVDGKVSVPPAAFDWAIGRPFLELRKFFKTKGYNFSHYR